MCICILIYTIGLKYMNIVFSNFNIDIKNINFTTIPTLYRFTIL